MNGTHVELRVDGPVRVHEQRLVLDDDARFCADVCLIAVRAGRGAAALADALFSFTPVIRFLSFQPGPLTSGMGLRISIDCVP